ncbi:hypothetical protein EJ377_01890 [Chryseobacterium arthrosphaerae]|uniref:Uncharacterized protein n=1 Tax=Chryseobacterium arthrosphaerae TaxID=651561 RepID=A0A3S0PRW2_9FLAO|nr:hypothetical protein EJ377_01890 [Chryseobacterium arthrosphaerae]
MTTDGDLITLRQKGSSPAEAIIDFTSKKYRYYRDYTDAVKYEHFRIGGQQIPLLELYTTQEYDEATDAGVDPGSFKLVRDISTTLNNKIVILYLEATPMMRILARMLIVIITEQNRYLTLKFF